MPKTISAPPAVPSAVEIANLPLLAPFRSVTFPNPESSPLIQSLLAEQEVANVVQLYQNREDTLRDELVKLINDAEKAEKEKAKELAASSSSAAAKNNNKVAKKKDKPKLSALVQKKIKDIESEIKDTDKLCTQYKQELIVYTQHTRGIFQSAYTKIALKLEVQNNSKAIEALEESFSFFCPRQTIATVVSVNDGYGSTQQQHQDVWDDSQRVAYVREMCPVMRAHVRPLSVGLFSLPYIKKFHCTPDTPVIVEALLDELYQKTITEELKSRLKDVMEDARLKVLRHCEEVLQKKTELTTELVRKHYRKKSIRLHPDRNGEENRPIFEEFTDARDVFSDVHLRQVYVTQMLEVFSKIGPDHIEIAHEAWNKKHRPDVAEQAFTKQRNAKGKGKDAPLQLEGVLDLSQTPRGVMVTNYRRNNSDIVKIAVYALQPKYEFYSKIKSIRVEMKSTTNEKRSFLLKRRDIIARIQLDCHRQAMLEPLVTVAETSLNPGLWEIVAYIQLDPMGTDIMNPNNASGESVAMKPSALMMFDVVDRVHEKLVNHFETAEGRCKQVYAELSSVVHKLRSNSSAQNNSLSVLERYGTYHNVLVRARQKYKNLEMMMEQSGLKSDIYSRLGDLLHESRQLFSEMQNSVNAIARKKENKCDAKRFKAYVATVLESNDPSTWMKNVSKAELCRNGGSPDPINRLYQLFIEGKGKYTLLFDSEMYKVAALREDLFSTKQCKELATRGEEVCLREKEEEEEAIAAEERKKKEEEAQAKMLKDIEMRHKWGMVGQNVTIKGLTSARGEAMNNKLARVHNYMIEKDRFEVELLRTKEKALLKVDNMVVYYGYIPDVHVPERHIIETTIESSTAPTPTTTSTNGVDKSKPRKAEKAPQAAPTPTVSSNGTDTSKMSKTIYVAASHSKRLTGKKGRKKKDLVDRSGAGISVKATIVNKFVPVHLNGSATAVWKAFALIQESIGPENVSEVEPSAPSPAPAAVKPPFCPTSTFQTISGPEADSSISKLLERSLDKGLRGLSATPETQISSPQYSFGDDLLMSKPAELPSEIGIKGLGLSSSKKSSNDTSVGSVSSLNDRSTASRAPSVSAAVRNDQLLTFLKSQQQCIKGSVEDFCNWLVKSEDIDSIAALKEAVVDEEYLNETIKVGNGESGVKGFKRKVFQRAVLDYQEPPQQEVAVAEAPHSVLPPMDADIALCGMDSDKASLGMSTLESAFLPSNLFGSPDFGSFTPTVTLGGNIQKKNEPPPELVCPIELVLMTNDPVLAADGVTYERRAITNWFKTNIAKIKKAEEALKTNPFSDSNRRVVENGITSPALGTKMANLFLTENINVRNMA
eukprot:CAMPEP_0113406952 /NCGR_PEP_ID=MMETSP0013_2-20120614/19790_1 /TAXON_ID=2843 ORGANISM="Skeletonema costatum, Strain 1716" /NCGR_SAMPLE_ID=MMETSP0013_2 /ASSEMBLY_ACC=CAM_ASM_000158 /LENGTH=1333 /DNA_ID=CAMNT_0000292841 /DNA_START=71 /DNA_END=4069 /DNA_ORIENTATION=- /assembly_acc=CAM_ASM_000158